MQEANWTHSLGLGMGPSPSPPPGSPARLRSDEKPASNCRTPDCVGERLKGADPHNLTRRLRLVGHRLLGEGVDPLVLARGRLHHQAELEKALEHHLSRSLLAERAGDDPRRRALLPPAPPKAAVDVSETQIGSSAAPRWRGASRSPLRARSQGCCSRPGDELRCRRWEGALPLPIS